MGAVAIVTAVEGITAGVSIQEVSSLGTPPESIVPSSTKLLANSVADPDGSVNPIP
jgi:hypothetical protein